MAVFESPAATGTEDRRGPKLRLIAAARIIAVRLRFFFALLAVLLLVGYWPVVRNYWDKLTRGGTEHRAAVSLDTEYWCPMCPGVLSEWPGKCPVCNMALVRRKKGEMAPLPDGVIARMQLSPYRIQLAGVRTALVEYRPLAQELTLVGSMQDEVPGGVSVKTTGPVAKAEIFEPDSGIVAYGRAAEITADAFPGRKFPARIAAISPRLSPLTRTLTVWLEIDDAKKELRPGMHVTGRVRLPVVETETCRQSWDETRRQRAAAAALAATLVSPVAVPSGAGFDPLIRGAGEFLLRRAGLTLCVPESAVVDTGTRRVVYVERMPGTFDGVEVWLGRRCGEHYPVLGGVAFGDRVVSAGALLIDAETRLNPSIAASYFGAERAGTAASPAKAEAVPAAADDQVAIDRQKLCPVTGEALGSMGPPVRVTVDGRTVFLCCKSCEPALRNDPAKYLSKLRDH